MTAYYRRTPQQIGLLMNKIAYHEGDLCVLACGIGDLLAPIAHEFDRRLPDYPPTNISSIRLVDSDKQRLAEAVGLVSMNEFPNPIYFDQRNIFSVMELYKAQRVLCHAPEKAMWGKNTKRMLDLDGLAHYLELVDLQLVNAAPSAAYLWLMVSRFHLAAENGKAVVLVNSSLTLQNEADEIIRRWLVENRQIEAIIQLPNMLVTPDPHNVIWIIRPAPRKEGKDYRILMVEGSMLGRMKWTPRKTDGLNPHRVWSYREREPIEKAYTAFLAGMYQECRVEGFSTCVSIDDVRNRNWDVDPAKYVWEQEGARDDSSAALAYRRAVPPLALEQ